MTAVRPTAKSLSAESGSETVGPPPVPSPEGDIEAMQDVLYDILANGMDPDQSDISTKAVELFLFEHARTPKSYADFCEFFAAQGLSMRTRARSVAPSLALPPIVPRVRADEMPQRLPVELQVAPVPPPLPVERPIPVEIAMAEPVAARRSKGLVIALWAGLGCLAALFVGVSAYGYAMITRLEKEVDRATQSGRDNQSELKQLRHDTVGLESSVAATGEMLQRVDQKSDLLLQSLLPAPNEKPRKRAP